MAVSRGGWSTHYCGSQWWTPVTHWSAINAWPAVGVGMAQHVVLCAHTVVLCCAVNAEQHHPFALLYSSEAKKNKPDLSASAAAVTEAGQSPSAAMSQPVTSDPGGATPTMSVADANQSYQAQQQQAYQSPQQQQEAWAAYNQYQQTQQAWAAYYSQYGQQVRGRGRAWVALVTCM